MKRHTRNCALLTASDSALLGGVECNCPEESTCPAHGKRRGDKVAYGVRCNGRSEACAPERK